MYKYFLFCFLIINQYSCSKDLLMNCNSNNYFTSSFHNMDNGFSNSQREVSTKLSEEDLDSMFSDSGLSCKEVLSQYFYCNICFNNNEEYIISYSGRKINLNSSENAIEFTNNLLSIIANMQFGSLEYDNFISNHP